MPEVLFVCVHNAGRSQMAAALLNARGEGRVYVRSAGSDPAERINPAVVEAMEEFGIDISEEFPKPMTDEVVRAAHAVVPSGAWPDCSRRRVGGRTRREASHLPRHTPRASRPGGSSRPRSRPD